MPLASNDGVPVTQFTMTTIEELGLLKMDFLGLRTLTVIKNAEEMVRRREPDFSMDNISYDDAATYDMLGRSETEGVFQLESTGMKQVLTGLQPKNLEDIIALISLYRPGPMDSIPTYLRNRHEPDKVRYKTPQLAHILDVTNGCIVYQEQVMQICRELAGFTLGQADLVRRAMSKKKHDVMEKERQHFVTGCAANGISEQAANDIFDDMSSFASYAFNKSHAACYAYVAFQTAYLKCHYPSEFMAALLTSVLDNTDKVIEYTGECQRLGIKVLPPSINVSDGGFTVDGKSIRFGLNATKNVGRNLIAAVVRERKEKPFASLYDFCRRLHGQELNRRAAESLVKCGAFDETGVSRKAMLENVDAIFKSVETDVGRNVEGQLDLFSQLSGESAGTAGEDFHIEDHGEFPLPELLKMEKEVSGLYLSGHPLDGYRQQIQKIGACRIADLMGEEARRYDGKHVNIVCAVIKSKFMTTRSNTMMAFTNVEDLSGTMEIIVFPKVLADCRSALQDNAVVVINGRVSVKEEENAKLVAEKITPIEEYSANGAAAPRPAQEKPARKGMYLKVPSRSCPQFAKVENLLSIFEGPLPVYIYFEDQKQLTLAPRNLWSMEHELLTCELKRILGDGNVAFK